MPIKLSSLNARGLSDRENATRQLRDLLSFGVGVAVIQETLYLTSMLECFLSNLLIIQHTGPASLSWSSVLRIRG